MELFVLFCVLQVADIYTTHRILSKGGRELNPLMDALFKRIGHVAGLVLAKVAACLLIYVYLPQIPEWLLVTLCVVYAIVVIHNFRQLKR